MRPRFCPNCAAPLPEGPHGAQEFNRKTFTQRNGVILEEIDSRVGWDCYCDACNWSGDIMLDYATEAALTKAAEEQP